MHAGGQQVPGEHRPYRRGIGKTADRALRQSRREAS